MHDFAGQLRPPTLKCFHYFFEKKNWQHDIAIFWISQLDFARRNTLKPLENLKNLGFTHGACLLFFMSLNSSHDFLSVIFGFLGKFWIDTEKIQTKKIFFFIEKIDFEEKNPESCVENVGFLF